MRAVYYTRLSAADGSNNLDRIALAEFAFLVIGTWDDFAVHFNRKSTLQSKRVDKLTNRTRGGQGKLLAVQDHRDFGAQISTCMPSRAV